MDTLDKSLYQIHKDLNFLFETASSCYNTEIYDHFAYKFKLLGLEAFCDYIKFEFVWRRAQVEERMKLSVEELYTLPEKAEEILRKEYEIISIIYNTTMWHSYYRGY